MIHRCPFIPVNFYGRLNNRASDGITGITGGPSTRNQKLLRTAAVCCQIDRPLSEEPVILLFRWMRERLNVRRAKMPPGVSLKIPREVTAR